MNPQGQMEVSQPNLPGLDDDIISPAFWDPNILSNTNWLDALGDDCFPLDLGFDTNGHKNGAWPAATPAAQPTFGTPNSALSIQSLTASHSSNEAEQPQEGEYYVDGQPARLPHVKRRRTTLPTSSPAQFRAYEGYSLAWRPTTAQQPVNRRRISDEMYGVLESAYHRLCLVPSFYPAFHSSDVPPQEVFDLLIASYWKSFDLVFPILHTHKVFPIQQLPLVLSMCTLGSYYLEAPAQFIDSLHEFAQRALREQDGSGLSTTSNCQAHLLLYVSKLYGRSTGADAEIPSHEDGLKALFRWAADECDKGSYAVSVAIPNWEEWIEREQKIRLSYAIWLIDAMYASHHQCQPALSLMDATMPLPSNERMWEAQTAEEWHSIYTSDPAPPALQEALQHLYIEKKLPRDRGEFARIIIIHGLYHRLWEVSLYFSNPLSAWEPTARRQDSVETLPKQPVWLPSISTFAKWQNSTCDALDILHWQANATIGQASGFEHPTVLHLHFARVVLLAPCSDLINIAKSAGNPEANKTLSDASIHNVRRWAVQHHYKARLAAVHAGVLFWHVRRYSADAFYESPSVALAALLLWAFGTYAPSRSSNRSAVNNASRPHDSMNVDSTAETRNGAEEIDGPVSDIILLDRPTDDELVQQFIRRGHEMQAHITGVGNLYTAKAPQRVLDQACKLLSTLSPWGANVEWMGLIQQLSRLSRNQQV